MTSISIILVLVVSIIVASAEGQPRDPYEQDMKVRKLIALSCIEETGADRRVIEAAMKTTILPRGNLKYKEFLACSYKKQKYQSLDGKTMLYDNIEEFLMRHYTKEELQDMQKCRTITGSNDAELAFNALECIMDVLKALDNKV